MSLWPPRRYSGGPISRVPFFRGWVSLARPFLPPPLVLGCFGAGEMARAGGANEYEAGLAGLAGGLVGGAASVAAPRLASRATPPPVDMAAARRAAPESLPPNLRTLRAGANAALEADLAANTRPTDAAVRALNNSLPEPIPMSRGQVSGRPTNRP